MEDKESCVLYANARPTAKKCINQNTRCFRLRRTHDVYTMYTYMYMYRALFISVYHVTDYQKQEIG